MKRVLVALFLLAVLGGVLLARQGAARPAAESVVAVDPHGSEIAKARTLVVGRTRPTPSQPGVLLNARLVKGTMPRVPTQGTVLTDEDCGGDAHGISNCLNRIRLANGREIAVRHPHDMHKIPCFAPGEPVRVVPA